MSRRRALVLIALLLALGGAALWWPVPDPQLTEVQSLQEYLARDETRRLPPGQQRELFVQLQSRIDQLSPAQRRIVFQERRRLLLQRIDHYRSLPKDEQTGFLNQEITWLNSLWPEIVSASAPPGAPPASGGRAPRPAGGPATAEPTPADPGVQERARKLQLDDCTPEERAKVADFVKQLIAQAKAAGFLAGWPDDPQAVLAMIAGTPLETRVLNLARSRQ